MAEPIAYLIYQDLKTTLEGIKRRDGYHRNVSKVSISGIPNWSTDPDAIYIPPPSGMPAEHEPNAYTTVNMTATLVCLVQDSNDTLQAMFHLMSDVVSALEPAASRTRGGHAVDTLVVNQFRSPFVAIDDPTRGSFAMDLQIRFDHAQTDPDTPIGG